VLSWGDQPIPALEDVMDLEMIDYNRRK